VQPFLAVERPYVSTSQVMKIVRLSDDFSAAAQITASDVQEVAGLGFKTIINNRPDLEGGPLQPLGAEIENAAHALGLAYIAYPVQSGGVTPEISHKFTEVLNSCPAPILAYCASGNRASKLYTLSRELAQEQFVVVH
jgi:sulfide:quinone oxidoreductase